MFSITLAQIKSDYADILPFDGSYPVGLEYVIQAMEYRRMEAITLRDYARFWAMWCSDADRDKIELLFDNCGISKSVDQNE